MAQVAEARLQLMYQMRCHGNYRTGAMNAEMLKAEIDAARAKMRNFGIN